MRNCTNNRFFSIVIAYSLIIGGFVGLVNYGSKDAQSETYVSGIISGFVETWDPAGSPYIIIGDVTVSSVSTLIIESSVVVKFNGYYSIYVDGTLMAIGTETNRINITSNMTVPNPGNWNRIQVNPTGHAEIKYCDISYGNYGIYLDSSSNNAIISNNILSDNVFGIYFWESSNNTIIGNNVSSNNGCGIYLWNSSNNKITHNNVSNNARGIHLGLSTNNTVTGNNVSSNDENGIYLESSSNLNIISSNYISSNIAYGINLHSSSNNKLTGNNFINNGIFLQGSQLSHFNSHEISTNNTVNGKPLYYHKNHSGINIDGISVGQLILANCTGINARNLQINKTDLGIEVAYSTNITITGSNISSNNRYGIYLWESSSNNITDNDVSSNNHGYGYTYGHGIYLDGSNGNNITDNNFSDHLNGIYLRDSDDNDITYNNASNNLNGIHLYSSRWNTIISNTMIEDGIVISGNQVEHWNTHNIDTTNTVNGKPVYYWKNQTSGIIPLGAGEVIIANCTNIIIENQEIDGGSIGVQLGFSSNNYITNNTVSSNNLNGIYLYYSDKNNNITNNEVSKNTGGIKLDYSDGNKISDNIILNNTHGIHLYYTSENKIIGNTFSNNYNGVHLWHSIMNDIIRNIISNNHFGLFLWSSSSNNLINHNSIINNINQAYDEQSDNYWDNGYPSGGNFWSDYVGFDNFSGPNQNELGRDGIGDTPYEIDSDSWDNYPLMVPFGNYFILYEGWNLISIPYIQPDTNLGIVLNSIKGSYDAVQWYNVSDNSDPWKHNSIKKPSHLNDLDDIHHMMGFWIHITQPGGVLFQYPGIQPNENQSITLHPGWNLVGYPSLISYNRTQGLNNITFGTDVYSIWTYNAATQKWEEIGELDHFEIGRGYWVHSKVEKSWDVPL